jgi:2-polyprenyl-3-methyl-5-hydroxy-6-metoxy-1,4-benzoquinol methylase
MSENSCNINDKGKSCCSAPADTNTETNLQKHWNNAYLNSPEEKLGWFETDLTPTLKLVSKTNLEKSARILNVGAGSTTLIDELIKLGYTDLIASDLSEVALEKLDNRIKSTKVDYVVDDLTEPTKLTQIENVDLWIDRAVLHFFTKNNEQDVYFELLKSKVNKNGFVILAEYNLDGATVCAGLPVHRYSKEMLVEKLGSEFELLESFDYTYFMPSGAERPYIYTLFIKRGK